MITSLDSYCDAFLYTHIETEGMMQGIPLEAVRPLRAATSKQLIVAGGISTNEEVEQLHAMGVDAVVGMAVYTGQIEVWTIMVHMATPQAQSERARSIRHPAFFASNYKQASQTTRLGT